MPKPPSKDDRDILYLYELFAAAGGASTPPVSPELAQRVKDNVSPSDLAVAERLYQAVRQAAQEAEPGEGLEALGERARAILARPH